MPFIVLELGVPRRRRQLATLLPLGLLDRLLRILLLLLARRFRLLLGMGHRCDQKQCGERVMIRRFMVLAFPSLGWDLL
uniref:Uncharacterized protein n=1 Tax=Agrobacterium deltaense TaxID=1183412 RepID=A0A2Z2Q0S2_9HYPH|nr:hypothetical protein [Agrobacterium deltaense]